MSDFRPIGSMLPCCGRFCLVCDFLFKLILERMQNYYKRANSIFQIKMPHCLVLGCKSGSKRGKNESGEQIFTTISLPKPPDIRLKWLEKINRLDYLTYSNQGRFMLS